MGSSTAGSKLAAVAVIAGVAWYMGSGGNLPGELPNPDLPGWVRDGPAGCPPEPVAGLDEAQMRHAMTITQVGVDMDMSDRAVVVALATAMQESRLRNLPHLGTANDHDSVGLFQQRPSQGWGTPEQVQDPQYAATQFYNALSRVDGWEQMRETDAAQAVQISAYPEAYQQHVAAADRAAAATIPCANEEGRS